MHPFLDINQTHPVVFVEVVRGSEGGSGKGGHEVMRVTGWSCSGDGPTVVDGGEGVAVVGVGTEVVGGALWRVSKLIEGMTLMMNLKIGNWKRVICTWHKFKRFLHMLLILDPSLIPSHCKSEQIDENDADNDLANERELLASLIEKIKCEIDDSKNRNKFLETSNKFLVEKLKGEIEDFKTKNKSLESSNNRFKEANNKLSETNKLLYNDFKKSQAELERRKDVEYASKVEID
nr:hypothetical protein [Tanacetum cinerariifolium]